MQQRIQAIIDLLENVRKRKGMYFQPVDGTAAMNFVHGVWAAADTLGIHGRRDAWWRAMLSRGWREQGTGPLPQMAERGMTAEQMADEVLAIEIDTWRALQAEAGSNEEG